MIFCLRQLQEKAVEQCKDLYIVFFDFKKAFDMVPREMLWKVLEKFGCPPKFVKILKEFHDGMTGRVSVSGRLSDGFNITKGVKQGDPAAPTLFTLFFTAVLKSMDQNLGDVYIKTRSDGRLFNLARLKASTKVRIKCILELLFADDAAMVSHSLEELQAITTEFARVSSMFGLEISVTKTELLYQASGTHRRLQPRIFINDNPIKTSEKFKYLGSFISNDNSIDAEISHRIQSATISYSKLQKRVWNNHALSIATKMKVYKTVILTALLYSVETLTLYKRHIRKLTTYQLRYLRQILNIKWEDKVSNVEVLRRANMPSVEALITTAQLRWSGHVVRMTDDRLPRSVLYGELLDGQRQRGGQKLRYKDVIKRHLKRIDCDVDTWEEKARDRVEWRGIVKEGFGKVESKQQREYELKRQSRHGTLQSDIVCDRCKRNFLSRAGLSSHVRANRC